MGESLLERLRQHGVYQKGGYMNSEKFYEIIC
jgi:hypothetical protein